MTGITYPPEMLPRQEDGDGEVWVVPPDDSFGCWQLGQAIYRERGVRAGAFRPVTAAERRQAAEGPVPAASFDALGLRVFDRTHGDIPPQIKLDF
jgi:hypothetical protein